MKPAAVIACCLTVAAAACAAEVADTAYYVLASASENQSTPADAARIDVKGTELVNGHTYHWWEMTVNTHLYKEHAPIGLRICSERLPLTSQDGIGHVHRYIYRTRLGTCFDYRNVDTGEAQLPLRDDFRENMLPQTSPYARYVDGFATVGTLMGHVLARTKYTDMVEPVDFSGAQVVELRPDLLVYTSRSWRADYAPKDEEGNWPPERAFTVEDLQHMIDSGFNLFGGIGDHIEFIQDQPVFYTTMPTYPFTFYRSNWYPWRMYLDEPQTRMGWMGRVPHRPLYPEQVAQNLLMDVAAHYGWKEVETTNYRESGAYKPFVGYSPTWETQYWSAWWQLADGAFGFIHEGRYEWLNYGWHPNVLFGKGIDGLTPMEMYNCFNAFLRGAARAYDNDWGMSVYPEGDPEMRLPAMIRSYDMGAKYIYAWNDADLPWLEQCRLFAALIEHAKEHPRGDIEELKRSAKVGIAFPRGWCFSWWGTWGAESDALSIDGARYADISAAGMWEGILLSRAGVEFDFLSDEPFIHDMGYERLIVIHDDGRKTFDPPLRELRAAEVLTLKLEESERDPVAPRMAEAKTDLYVKRAKDISIDADLSDWTGAQWTRMTRPEHGYGDSFDTEVTLTNVETKEEVDANVRHYMGFEYGDFHREQEDKYRVSPRAAGEGCIVTKIYPGSPADQAGLWEGDAIHHVNGRRTRWPFEMWRELENNQKRLGQKVVLDVRRSGRERFLPEGDCEAEFAFAVDEQYLYFAAKVLDDMHHQRHFGWEYWMGDCVQVGLDPTLDRSPGYTTEGNEVGFVLKDGRALCWRWKGRPGKPVGEVAAAKVAAVREGQHTIYEAAVPLAELAPLSPDLWNKCGYCVVVNDSDGERDRKGRLELVYRAMTAGKNLDTFPVMEFEPSPETEKINAAVFWDVHCTQTPGEFELTVAGSSATTDRATLAAELRPLDSPHAIPQMLQLHTPLHLTHQAQEHKLLVGTESPPGMYSLKIAIRDASGRDAAVDELPVFVY